MNEIIYLKNPHLDSALDQSEFSKVPDSFVILPDAFPFHIFSSTRFSLTRPLFLLCLLSSAFLIPVLSFGSAVNSSYLLVSEIAMLPKYQLIWDK